MTPRATGLDWVREQAERHALSDWDALDLTPTPHPSQRFLAEPLTPLFHHPIYGELAPDDQLRYNQLCGMAANEVMARLESNVVIPCVEAFLRWETDPAQRDCLQRFIDDEKRHTEFWRRLNRASDPTRYAANDEALVGPLAPGLRLFRALIRRPWHFPFVVWMMLAMEERSGYLARAMARDPDTDPRYQAAYRLHLVDELRHTAIDTWLIARSGLDHARLAGPLNAAFIRFAVHRVILPPVRAGAAVVRALVAERPHLRALLPRLLAALAELPALPAYRATVLSPATSPGALALLPRTPSLQRLAQYLDTVP
jgi:hypothetical protein